MRTKADIIRDFAARTGAEIVDIKAPSANVEGA